MKIVANLGVKDEVELIGRTIEHLRHIGVDHIYVHEFPSTDGTAEVVAEAARASDVTRIQVDDTDHQAFDGWNRGQLELIKRQDADWILLLDADELWIPRFGSIKESVSLVTHGILVVNRFNVPLSDRGPHLPAHLVPEAYDELLLITERIPNFHEHMRDNPDVPWVLGVPGPKVMVRPAEVGTLHIAGHFADHVSSETNRVGTPADLFIAHLPFTTLNRFARKIRNMTRHLVLHAQDFRGLIGWHWRRWAALEGDRAAIEAEFNRQVFDQQHIAALRAKGTICSAAQVFADASSDS